MLAPCYPATLPLLPAAIAMLELVHLAGGHAAPPAPPKQQQQQQEQGPADGMSDREDVEGCAGGGTAACAGDSRGPAAAAQPCWWRSAAASALAVAGLRPGELALVLGRHFSVRAGCVLLFPSHVAMSISRACAGAGAPLPGARCVRYHFCLCAF